MTYVPAVSIVSNAFSTKRPIAIGIAATGSAVGGTVLPIMFRELTPRIGFGWTNRIFGFLILAVSVVAIPLLRPSSRASERRGALFDFSALREAPYVFLCIGVFFVELGFWIPPFMLTPYATLSLGTSTEYAFYLLAIMNAGSFAGRILPAYVAQIKIIGPAWVLAAGSMSLGVLVLAWIGIHNTVGITIWAVCMGFMSGIVVSMPNTVLARLSPFSKVGTR